MARRANILLGAAIAAVLALAAAALLVPGAPGGSPGGAGASGLVAVVHDSDGRAIELPLSEDSQTTVSTELGTNVVTVEDGSVRVSDADCDNHDCMRQGAIAAPGGQIICLPHRLWIEVVPAGGPSGQMDEGAVARGSSGGSSSAVPGAAPEEPDAGELDAVAR